MLTSTRQQRWSGRGLPVKRERDWYVDQKFGLLVTGQDFSPGGRGQISVGLDGAAALGVAYSIVCMTGAWGEDNYLPLPRLLLLE